MTWPNPDTCPSTSTNTHGPYCSSDDFSILGTPPLSENVPEPTPAPARDFSVALHRNAKAHYKPSPAKNVDEFKPKAPQVGPRAEQQQLDTPNKKFEEQERTTHPAGWQKQSSKTNGVRLLNNFEAQKV